MTSQENKKTNFLIRNRNEFLSLLSILLPISLISVFTLYRSHIRKSVYISILVLTTIMISLAIIKALVGIMSNEMQAEHHHIINISPRDEIHEENGAEIEEENIAEIEEENIAEIEEKRSPRIHDSIIYPKPNDSIDLNESDPKNNATRIDVDKKSEKVTINYQDRLKAEDIDQILKNLKGEKSVNNHNIFVSQTIELISNFSKEIIEVEYKKVKDIFNAMNNKLGITVIPVIYASSATACGTQNTAGHTDIMLIDNTAKNTRLTYIATANWLSQEIKNRFIVQDVNGTEHDIDEDSFNTLQRAMNTGEDTKELFIIMRGGGEGQEDILAENTFNLKDLPCKHTEKKGDPRYTLETVKNEIHNKVNFFSSIDRKEPVHSFEPLCNIKSEDIKVIQPCISWYHYTCGHAAIEGVLRHLFNNDNRIQNANEIENSNAIIARLKKLENGKLEEVIKEIQDPESHKQIDNITSITTLDQTQQHSL